eukprot:717494-Rhodomonas_salina.3
MGMRTRINHQCHHLRRQQRVTTTTTITITTITITITITMVESVLQGKRWRLDAVHQTHIASVRAFHALVHIRAILHPVALEPRQALAKEAARDVCAECRNLFSYARISGSYMRYHDCSTRVCKRGFLQMSRDRTYMAIWVAYLAKLGEIARKAVSVVPGVASTRETADIVGTVGLLLCVEGSQKESARLQTEHEH